MSNREKFLEAFVGRLKEYDWYERRGVYFQEAMEKVLDGKNNNVMLDGEAVKAGWTAAGRKGKPTYKGLREIGNS